MQRRATDAAAGSRGSTGRAIRLAAILLTGLLIVGVGGYLVVPGFRASVDDALAQAIGSISRDYVAVRPSGQAHAGHLDGHPAQMAFDENRGTYWAASVDGVTPIISVSFSPAASISKVLITSGASEDFTSQDRPRRIRLAFKTPTENVIYDQELLDTKEPQVIDVDVSGASDFSLNVFSVYPAPGGEGVAITEIEFRGPSSQ